MTKRPFILTWIALCFGFGLTACASSMTNTKPEDPHGLIDLNARMPVGQSPYGIAYGAPSPGGVRPDAANVDEFLKPQAKEKQKLVAARAVVPQRIERDAAPAVEAAPEQVAFEPVVSLEPNQEQLLALAAEPPPPSSDDTSRYAERESQNQNLEKFRGGDAIVITSGALIVILLVVILVLLLT